MYPAHIILAENTEKRQTVVQHVRNTAGYCAENLKMIGLEKTGYLTGLLHDMGKCTNKFKDYIEKASQGLTVQRGSVNHTFAGVIYLFEKFHGEKCINFQDTTCEIIAYAIGAHHGLFDCIADDAKDGFLHRLQKDRIEICYDEAVENFFNECAHESEIESLFNLAQQEIIEFINSIYKNAKTVKNGKKDKSEVHYCVGMLSRMILSALVDADRQDTAEFCGGIFYVQDIENQENLWSEQLTFVEEKISQFDTAKPINHIRRKISDDCKLFAEKTGSIYRLTVPTGSGKTLSSLRYALAHAKAFHKKRLFFVIPLLSVIEQNAKVIQNYLKNPEIILEHHSNVLTDEKEFHEADIYDLLSENWKSPIIITTLVQLLNTLFSGKISSVRRMNSLSDSVIIIDEVQSIPYKIISIFNSAMNFLSECCGVTIVLCSATQPCFESAEHAIKFNGRADIVPYQVDIFDVFKRTNVIDKTNVYGYTFSELADFAVHVFSDRQSLLFICNTKSEAKEIFKLLQEKKQSGILDAKLFHLSTSMCMQHRIETLKKINACLEHQERTICVSTQLVEAGVDFSFESVIRVLAGIDNIAQAAGRCNRNGEFDKLCEVYIVNIQNERLSMLKDIKLAQSAAKSAIEALKHGEENFDLLSDRAVNIYYNKLFKLPEIKNQFDYPLPKYYTDIYDMLSTNDHFIRRDAAVCGRYFVNQSFKTAGEAFAVFEDNTYDVIVPHDDNAIEIISNLSSEKARYDILLLKGNLTAAKPYTVSVYEYQLKKLLENGALGLCADGHAYYLMPGYYNQDYGMTVEGIKGIYID